MAMGDDDDDDDDVPKTSPVRAGLREWLLAGDFLVRQHRAHGPG
jgi:hypothetical protein